MLATAIHYLVGVALLIFGGLLVSGSIAPPSALPLESARWESIPGDLIGPSVRLKLLGGAAGLAGLFALAIGRKLRRGRQWVRLSLLVASGCNLAGTLYFGIVVGKRTNPLLGVVAPVLCLILLNTPAARTWFRRRRY